MKITKMLALAGLLAVPGLAFAGGDKHKEKSSEQASGMGSIYEGGEARTGMPMGPSAEDQNKVFQAKKEAMDVKGKVKSVEANKITLDRSDKNLPEAHLMIVTGQTQVKLDGKQANITDLQPGAEVRAKFQLAGEEAIATEIDAKPMKGEKTGSGSMGGQY